jgi:hypothetical protein
MNRLMPPSQVALKVRATSTPKLPWTPLVIHSLLPLTR